MIVEFSDKALEELFNEGKSKGINKIHHRSCLLILDAINAAESKKDLVGVKDFHPLKGDRRGEYAMHVNKNVCITFRFDRFRVYDVKLEDYH